MGQLVHISGIREFSLSEARKALSVISAFTAQSVFQVESLVAILENAEVRTGSRREFEIQEQISDIIERWQQKVEKLGGSPQGLWLVDFDFGGGYYCWKYPEPDILYWHGYSEGFSGRKNLEPLL